MKKRSFLIIFVVLAVVLCSCGNEEAINSSGGNDFMEEIFSHFEETLKENEDSADENNKTDEYGSTVYGEGKITDDIVIEFKDEEDNLIIGNGDIERVSAVYTEMGQYCLGIKMTEVGREKFAAATRENIGRSISIVIDDMLVSAPTVGEEIDGGEIYVTGLSSYEELMDLFEKLTGR